MKLGCWVVAIGQLYYRLGAAYCQQRKFIWHFTVLMVFDHESIFAFISSESMNETVIYKYNSYEIWFYVYQDGLFGNR